MTWAWAVPHQPPPRWRWGCSAWGARLRWSCSGPDEGARPPVFKAHLGTVNCLFPAEAAVCHTALPVPVAPGCLRPAGAFRGPFLMPEEAYFHSAQASASSSSRCQCTNPCCAAGPLSTACPWYPFWPKSFVG